MLERSISEADRGVSRRSPVVRRSCDGAGLLAAFRASVANVELHVDEINELNVFPVPDGDTGSNMLATVRLALGEAEGVAGAPADRIAAAIAFGALMGARGNSGVITSQILGGMARGLTAKRRFDGLDLARCLRLGSDSAYAAVKQPVEGTILTVVREAAEAASAAAQLDASLEFVLTAFVDAADQAVTRTPTLLPVLREAGVVDAGGQGLFRLFEGALQWISGARPAGRRLRRGGPAAQPVAPRVRHGSGDGPRTDRGSQVGHGERDGHPAAGFGFETMFLLLPHPGGNLDLTEVRSRLEAMGESVVVAGDKRAVKVHIHSAEPDDVIALGLTLGTVSRVSVENLDAQARAVRERRADAFMDHDRPTAQQDGSLAPTASKATSPNGSRATLGIVAVASGDGLAGIFHELGVSAVVRGGQTANPSTGELVSAIQAIDADEVLLLSNNPNVVLAARQAARLVARPVHVVPTRNAAEGFAALLALDPAHTPEVNAASMTERGQGIATLQVTCAVRDARVSGRAVREGQTIVLDPDDGLVAVDDDLATAVMRAVATFPSNVELISLFHGQDVKPPEGEALARQIALARPTVEVELRDGGQPHYRYLISGE